MKAQQPSEASNQRAKPLTGLRMLEVAEMVAGPFCGKLLAALGAQVIKIEVPGVGDPARRRGPFPGDVPHPERSGLFLYLNTGKKGITLNLEDPQGQDILRQTLEQADLLVHDRQPRQAEDQGLGPDALAQIDPGLIGAAITPFGSSGPYSGYRAYDINVFHAGGEGYLLPNGLALDTFPQRAPLVAGSHMGSYQGGLTAAVGLLAAVFARRNGVSGQQVDCSMQEAQLTIGYLPVQRLESEGFVEDRFSRFFRVGGVMAAQDGYVELLTLEPRQWRGLWELLGKPDWASDEKFQDPAKYGPAINQNLGAWAAEHSKEWLYRQGQAHGVPIAPYYSPREVFQSRQQRARGFYTTVEHPAAGNYEYAGLPFRFGDAQEPPGRAPLLGEHNLEVYQEQGYSAQDLVDLARSGVI